MLPTLSSPGVHEIANHGLRYKSLSGAIVPNAVQEKPTKLELTAPVTEVMLEGKGAMLSAKAMTKGHKTSALEAKATSLEKGNHLELKAATIEKKIEAKHDDFLLLDDLVRDIVSSVLIRDLVTNDLVRTMVKDNLVVTDDLSHDEMTDNLIKSVVQNHVENLHVEGYEGEEIDWEKV